MSFPQGHLRPLFPWQQGHYANLLLQQQNNVSTGREPSSRSTNQTREVTADVQVPRFTDFSIPEQRAMINNNMVMPADSIALVESARNLYQSGMAGNLTQTKPELQSRGPPPLYNRLPRSNVGTLGHPRGPPPLMNASIRQQDRAKRRKNVSQKSTGNQFRPEIQPQIHQFSAMPPNLNQISMMPPQFISTSMHSLIRPPLQPHINHTVSRNPIRPDVPNVQDNIDTIRITNPFENEVNFPRTRTSPQYPADISSMSHQGNINSRTQMTAPSMNSLHGLQNNSTSMNVNSNLLPSYSNSGMSNIDPRLFNSSLFPRQFPLPGYRPENSAENHQMPNILPRMPVQSSNPFKEFILLPPSINNNSNPLTSSQNSVCPDIDDDDISDINVMGRWYKPPSNEDEGERVSDKTIPTALAPEKTQTTEIVAGKENPPEHGNTFGNLVTAVIKTEIYVDEEGMDRIHRPSKQTKHTRLENVVDKLYGDRVVSPVEEIVSTFPLAEESTSSGQDVLSYNNDITTTSPLSAVQPATTSQISSEQPELGINSLETPASIETSEISEVQSDVNHINSSPDMTLCILNTFSLSSSDIKLSQDSTMDGTSTSEESSEVNPTDIPSKRNCGKKASSSPKKVPPLRIKLPFNKLSSKKKGFGNSKKSFGSPVKTAFHHFAKGAKKLIEIRKPKGLMFDEKNDENQGQSIGKPAIPHVTKSDKKSTSNGKSSSSLKADDERSLDDVVAKVQKHRKRRRSTMLLDSTGSVIGEMNPKQSAETGNVGKKKRIPKNTKKRVTNSVTKCTEKRAGKNVKRDKKLVYEDFVIESTENSDCDEEMSNGNDAVLKESREFSEEGNKGSEGAKEVSDNLSKEERNRDLIEKNWVQIEARLRLVEKRYKEGKNKSPVKLTSSETTSKINNENISSQVNTSSKSLSIENKSSPKKKLAEDVAIENKSGSKPRSTENVAIQNKSGPKRNSGENVTIENKSNRKRKSDENVTFENNSSPKRKSVEKNIRIENKSSPKRKSDEHVNSKKSISNKSPKEMLSNAGSCQSGAKRQSPKNGDQASLSKKKEDITSAKEKKNSRNNKAVNENDMTHVGDSAHFKMPAKYRSVSKFGRNKKENTGEENIDKDSGEKPSKRKKTSHKTNSKNTGEKLNKRPSNGAVLDLSPSENMLQKDVGEKQATKKSTATTGCGLIVGEERVDRRLGTSRTVEATTQTTCISKVTSPSFFVTFHGKRVLCLNSPSGKLLLMREILRRNFKDLVKSSSNNTEGQYKQVYLAKERDLKITYREIPEEHRSLAFKYLIFEKLLREKKKAPQHLGVISVEDALRLYHYMNGLKACSERCIELWSPPDESAIEIEAKGTCSESEQVENRCESRTSSGTANDGYESDVTIPYTDDSEKGEISTENQSEASTKNKNIIQTEIENESSVEDKNNVAEDTRMNDTEDETDSRLVLRGGVAECYNSYFRYIVVEGEKFYPYEDLVLKFGKIAMTHALQSRLPEKFRAYKCTEIEADFINKLEDTLPSLCVEATLLEEALFNKVACALEFFNSNTIVDLTEDGPPLQSSANGTNIVNGMEVDLTQDDPETVSKMDIDEEINPSQDDSVLELIFDSQSDDENLQCSESITKSTVSNDENLQYSESITKSTMSNDENLQYSESITKPTVCNDENLQNIESIKNDLSENMIESEVDVEEKKHVEISQTTHENNPLMEEKDMDLVIPVKSELNQTEKAPCDSTSNIGNLGEMSRQISMTFEENNNNDHNEPSSLMAVENNDLAQQFSAMLNDLEKEFSVSAGSDSITEEEISQISHMQKMIEEAINDMATDMTPSGTVDVDNEMNIRQAVKICMESFKDSNKDMTQAFLNILKQGVVYKAKFSSLKQQLTEFKSGTDKVLSSCDKYEDMLNKLKKTFQGEG